MPISNPTVLVLGLRDKDLVFPGGRPWCLRCGAEATGTARVFFQSDPGFHLTSGGRLLGGIQAIAGQVSFRAALCKAHREAIWKMRLALLGIFVAMIGSMIVAASLSGPERGGTPVIVGAVISGALFLFGMYPLWRRKDRGGLTCDATKTGDGRLVLSYSGPAPRPAWPVEEGVPPPQSPRTGRSIRKK